MEPKVTTMVLKVDLQCSCCYKKVKRLLCKYPQIRDQVFDEKTNTVTIKVVCCSPEKIRDKLCCKGGKSIKSIEIKEPPKPPQPQPKKADDKPKPAPEADKPKAAPPQEKQPKQTPDAAKPKSDATPAPVEKAPETAKKNGSKDGSKPAAEAAAKPASEAAAKPAGKPAGEPASKPATEPAPAPKTTPEPPKQMQCQGMPMPVQGYPPVYPIPVCCGQCYHGQPGGPCYQGYGGMPPPQPGCDPYAYGGAAYRTGYYPSRCDYFSEENPAACAIM